jgi:hypothetical protein
MTLPDVPCEVRDSSVSRTVGRWPRARMRSSWSASGLERAPAGIGVALPRRS